MFSTRDCGAPLRPVCLIRDPNIHHALRHFVCDVPRKPPHWRRVHCKSVACVPPHHEERPCSIVCAPPCEETCSSEPEKPKCPRTFRQNRLKCCLVKPPSQQHTVDGECLSKPTPRCDLDACMPTVYMDKPAEHILWENVRNSIQPIQGIHADYTIHPNFVSERFERTPRFSGRRYTPWHWEFSGARYWPCQSLRERLECELGPGAGPEGTCEGQHGKVPIAKKPMRYWEDKPTGADAFPVPLPMFKIGEDAVPGCYPNPWRKRWGATINEDAICRCANCNCYRKPPVKDLSYLYIDFVGDECYAKNKCYYNDYTRRPPFPAVADPCERFERPCPSVECYGPFSLAASLYVRPSDGVPSETPPHWWMRCQVKPQPPARCGRQETRVPPAESDQGSAQTESMPKFPIGTLCYRTPKCTQ